MAEVKFLESCKTGKLGKVKTAINNEIDINCTPPRQYEGKTALILACEHGHDRVVTHLLSCGANVDGIDKYGMTALHHAAFKGHNNICQILIHNDADIDCYDKASLTPLHEAASSGKGGVIKVLLKAGASVVLTDKNGKTSLDIAKEFNRTTCIKYLTKGFEKHNKRMAKLKIKHLKPSKSQEQKDNSKSAPDIHNNSNNNSYKHKKHNKRAVSQYIGGSQKGNKKSKRLTDTEKMSNFATQLNLFGDNNDQAEIDKLNQQLFGLKDRVKKLQNDKEKLNTKMANYMEENKEVNELRQELDMLKESIKIIGDENEKQDKDIQIKDREIQKLSQQILKQKHKFEKEKKDITKKYKDKIKTMEQKYATKVVPDDEEKTNEDEDINDMIDECGNDIGKLKNKLYKVMEIMKKVDGENEELKVEINELNKKHTKKVDALLNNYTAVRDELSDKGPISPGLDNENVSVGSGTKKKGHKRKNSKILRKVERFVKWIENEVALPQYIDNFHDRGYDRIDVVKTLGESDLKDIGISKVGHRRLFMEKIQELVSKYEDKQTLVQLMENSREVTPVDQPQTIEENDDEDNDMDDDDKSDDYYDDDDENEDVGDKNEDE
eukprot:856694_1